MEEKPNYFSIIPAEVRYDKNLRDKAKLLYGEITALSNKDGCCWASNKYFADLYEVSITTISTLVKELVDNGYIESEIIYKDGTKEIEGRYLKIFKEGYLKNFKEGYLKNFKHNNTSINNTSNNIKENIKRKVFIKPSIEEIQQYCNERKNGINANAFYDFYESKDWMVGKNKMKDWKACIRTWEQRNNKNNVIKPDWLDKKIEKDEWVISDEDRQKLGI